jgi:alkylresorcinol/alkylpyrone synthase
MPRIQAVATAVPPTRVDQELAVEFARAMFADRIPDLERLLPLFANSGIRTRYFAAPQEWFFTGHDLAEKSDLYVREATRLSAEAAGKALDKSGLEPSDVDYVLYVNTTGLATPSIDARLIDVMGLRHDVRRTPVWGLGCAGGAAGLSHAHHYALGHPEARVLVIATELCGLTFLPDDISKSNLVATALFGDGAAAAVICGDDCGTEGLQILDTRSRFYPDSLDVMGWTVLQEGLQVVFAQRIPDIVEETSAEDIGTFLGAHDLKVADIDAFLLHPGGTKVMEAYLKALALEEDQLALSAGVLRDYGNMSSATVLYVLERYLEQNGPGNGGHGLVSALGPGFCSESLLLGL